MHAALERGSAEREHIHAVVIVEVVRVVIQVAPEKRMLSTQLIVDAKDARVLIVGYSSIESDLTARILCRGKSSREVQSSGREQRFIDAINNVAVFVESQILNRRSQNALHTITAGLRCEGGEISFQHRRSWNELRRRAIR